MPKRFSTSLYLPDLKSAVADAEKVVGYPTSFLSLRYLLSDEVANVALQLRKLVGSSHPLLHTVEHLLRGSRETESSRGLVVLLMAKAAGQPLNTDIDSCTGVSSRLSILNPCLAGGIILLDSFSIMHSQRTLAELTETIHLAQIIHRSIPSDEGNRQEVATKMREYDEGNKMAILSGDFLLAHASKGLASLCNTKVVSMISQAIADFAASQFMSTEDTPGKVSLQRWIEMKYYESASLLAHACCGAVTLANHGQEMQEHAFNFGKHLSLAWQVGLKRRQFYEVSSPLSNEI
ncbi:unnamed protein product [Cyprideis torosa]|uniref:Uncharacterized protein n=1 Tax=Cyprideis torosa TaxID=163714 RepID=A0A7R8W437_9CRUS|nr:unnamed protein product [Cyprideis torosa]CAG0883699.1 unnamed protein product [Cyprideis torosa]